MKVVLFFLCLACSVQSFSQTALKYDFVVAKDGSGNFTTIQEAIPVFRTFFRHPLKPLILLGFIFNLGV